MLIADGHSTSYSAKQIIRGAIELCYHYDMMHYRGYSANVEYSAEDGCFVGHIAGIRDVVGFHGGSTFELEAAFKEAVDDYLESRKWNTAVDKLDQPDNDFVRIAARRVLERSEW